MFVLSVILYYGEIALSPHKFHLMYENKLIGYPESNFGWRGLKCGTYGEYTLNVRWNLGSFGTQTMLRRCPLIELFRKRSKLPQNVRRSKGESYRGHFVYKYDSSRLVNVE